MARPKGKLFALLAIFAAIGIVTATGAFTSVQADRTVTATVDNDTAALVGLEPHSGPNGYDETGGGSPDSSEGYAQISATAGTLRINLGGYSGGTPQDQSLNYNATTTFDNVFNITNNGRQNFEYYITRNGEHANADNAVVFYNGNGYTSSENVTGSSNSATLNQGLVDEISIEVDLSNVDENDVGEGQDLLEGITIHADAV